MATNKVTLLTGAEGVAHGKKMNDRINKLKKELRQAGATNYEQVTIVNGKAVHADG